MVLSSPLNHIGVVYLQNQRAVCDLLGPYYILQIMSVFPCYLKGDLTTRQVLFLVSNSDLEGCFSCKHETFKIKVRELIVHVCFLLRMVFKEERECEKEN
jgi:hypothetical protein